MVSIIVYSYTLSGEMIQLDQYAVLNRLEATDHLEMMLHCLIFISHSILEVWTCQDWFESTSETNRWKAGQFEAYLVPSQNVHMGTVSWMVNGLFFDFRSKKFWMFELSDRFLGIKSVAKRSKGRLHFKAKLSYLVWSWMNRDFPISIGF